MIEISINQAEYLPESREQELLDIITEVLAYTFEREAQATANYEMDITFMDNESIHEINNTYRGVDRATDVISFAFNDEEDAIIIPEGMDIPKILGELFISVEKAQEQAVAYGHSFERELLFLVVHGMLHLLGFDHETAEEEQIMFAKQQQILEHFNITR